MLLNLTEPNLPAYKKMISIILGSQGCCEDSTWESKVFAWHLKRAQEGKPLYYYCPPMHEWRKINHNYHSLSTYYIPHIYLHLILETTLQEQYHEPHFTDDPHSYYAVELRFKSRCFFFPLKLGSFLLSFIVHKIRRVKKSLNFLKTSSKDMFLFFQRE